MELEFLGLNGDRENACVEKDTGLHVKLGDHCLPHLQFGSQKSDMEAWMTQRTRRPSVS